MNEIKLKAGYSYLIDTKPEDPLRAGNCLERFDVTQCYERSVKGKWEYQGNENYYTKDHLTSKFRVVDCLGLTTDLNNNPKQEMKKLATTIGISKNTRDMVDEMGKLRKHNRKRGPMIEYFIETHPEFIEYEKERAAITFMETAPIENNKKKKGNK